VSPAVLACAARGRGPQGRARPPGSARPRDLTTG